MKLLNFTTKHDVQKALQKACMHGTLFKQSDLNLTASTVRVFTKTEVNNKLANKTDKIATNNSAIAWSSGLASDAYHYIDTGSDALVLQTPSGAISASLLGNAGGSTYDGRAMFYQDLVMLGTLRFGSGSSLGIHQNGNQ